MEGVQAWNAYLFHPDCPVVDVRDLGGFKYLWCPSCRCLCNLDAVAPKYATYNDALPSPGVLPA